MVQGSKTLKNEPEDIWRQSNRMLKVVKFGGSSLASAEQFAKVGKIIKADPTRRYVIPSAPGKRSAKDTKVTDMLYDCYALVEEGEDIRIPLMKIKERYDAIIYGLNLKLSLEEEFKKIAADFKDKVGVDYAASRGEYLNGLIMAEYLGYEFVDAADVIFFDEEGNFEAEKTNRVLAARLKDVERAVIPGFYGSSETGRIKTFSRGGSDITGSIVAGAVKASVYENWTDVSGFLIADPRIIKNPEAIKTITYRELRELSYMGASVLHEDAVFPVRKSGIPINIRNTNAPEDEGTWIVDSTCHRSKYTITGIAGKKGFVSVNIDKDMMNSEVGFCRKVLSAFEENGISIEHMPSGIDTMTVFVHQPEFEGKEQSVISAIRRLAEPDTIELETDLALIAVVGRGMKSTRGTAGRIFSALAHANINVKMIDQGSSELNIIIGVSNNDFESAIRAIYDIFVMTQL
jgi:aspartate kinase